MYENKHLNENLSKDKHMIYTYINIGNKTIIVYLNC